MTGAAIQVLIKRHLFPKYLSLASTITRLHVSSTARFFRTTHLFHPQVTLLTMPNTTRPDINLVIARTLINLIIFELSFDDADGTVRDITLNEMLVSLRHLAVFISSNNMSQLYSVRDALPTTPVDFSNFVSLTQYVPRLLDFDWMANIVNTSPPLIRALRSRTDVVLRRFGRILGRRHQNQVAGLIATLRQDLWHFDGAGGEIVNEHPVPVAHMYRRAMRHRLSMRAVRRLVDSLHF